MIDTELISDPEVLSALPHGVVLRDVDGDTWQVVEGEQGTELRAIRGSLVLSPIDAATFAPYRIVASGLERAADQ